MNAPRAFRPRRVAPVLVPPPVWPMPHENSKILRMCFCQLTRSIGRSEIFFTLLWAAWNVLRHRNARASVCDAQGEPWLFIGWSDRP